MIPFLQADNLMFLPHGFFTRQGGVSAGTYESLNTSFSSQDDPAKIAKNRESIEAQLGVQAGHLLSCQQVHSADVVNVTEPWSAAHMPQADALVTKLAGVALGILTADCAPVLLADKDAGVIGAAHAGWRGALGGVIENTLLEMEKLGAQRRNICAAVGPCIGRASYEVEDAFCAPFIAEDRENTAFFKKAEKEKCLMFDLPSYVVQKLKCAGLENISPSPADTCKDEAVFFSYRRSSLAGEKDTGRQLSVIVIPI